MGQALDRKQFLTRTGVALGAVAGFSLLEDVSEAQEEVLRDWTAVRRLFRLEPGVIHLGSFLLASHPEPVRKAIGRHRRALDANPVDYLHGRWPANEAAVLAAAARYLRGRPEDIALTDSTTMGLSLLYAGLDVRAGQELLTSTHDFFVTHESLDAKAARAGATVRKVALYDRPETASESSIVERVVSAITPKTRVLALTWVHSSTGVKLPIRRIATAIEPLNASRGEADRIIFCVDGVHGFGVEDASVAGLGCDFFATGCHKWLFGPRGTGLVWGSPGAWPAANPTIPSFTGTGTPGNSNSPGGFHSFEHRWALAEAFALHRRIGRPRIASRIHGLNRQFKEGLAAMPHVRLHTPRAAALSAGLVCFDVGSLSPETVVRRLRDRRIVATVSPYSTPYVRVAPSILNSSGEIRRTLDVIRRLR
ncbi:MAG TPA: aminotransferase class V-fold PLP-dependent enzyme [Gaiellaceae bacterium]|nr:aminotransferase class V-fold PLP-dependent enzyme [Gaiellaceae bacterium]